MWHTLCTAEKSSEKNNENIFLNLEWAFFIRKIFLLQQIFLMSFFFFLDWFFFFNDGWYYCFARRGILRRNKRAIKNCSDLIEKWRGGSPYSEDLASTFIHCYLKGKCEIDPHRASSTRTMMSHLFKYLKDHVHFIIFDSCRDGLYRYVCGSNEKSR